MISIRCHTKQQQRICCCSEENVKRHPKRTWRIYTRGEESRKMPFKVIDSSLGVMLLFPVFLEQHSCHRSEWRLTISVTPKRCRRLAAVMKKTIRCHPERMWRICYRNEESGKMSFKVIDSSLGVMLLFPVFPTRHSCHRSEWRLTISVTRSDVEDLLLWWRKP